MAVDGLHTIDFSTDKRDRFLLTPKMKGVETTSFLDNFWSFPGWCGVRGSSEVTLLHCKMTEGGLARVDSKALVEANRKICRRQDRVPRR